MKRSFLALTFIGLIATAAGCGNEGGIDLAQVDQGGSLCEPVCVEGVCTDPCNPSDGGDLPGGF